MIAKRILIFLTGFLMLFTFGCSSYQKAEQLRAESSLFAMNTYMTFTAYGENSEAALESAKQKIQELESLWSVTDEDSEIYQANHSSGQSVEVSVDTAALVSFALKMAGKTEGALEPTLYPVLRAWGFTTEQKQVPSQEELDQLLLLVDYSQISLQGDRITVPEGVELDLGAVGKGYAADLATEVLREQGIESALLSLGGNIQAVGSRPDGTDWRIGIRAPWETENLGVLQVRDAAVVTSGGYENYFVVELQIPNPIPIPGAKLGLANIITVYAVYQYRAREVFLIVIVRILLGSFFSGNMIALLYSLAGGLLCLTGMIFFKKVIPQKYIWLCSVFGAVFHNLGQTSVACLIAGWGMVVYFPFLVFAGCLSGIFTGICVQLVRFHIPIGK